MNLTGYLISVSIFFPRELRYQKINESKRKNIKIMTFLLAEPAPFFAKFSDRIAPVLSIKGI